MTCCWGLRGYGCQPQADSPVSGGCVTTEGITERRIGVNHRELPCSPSAFDGAELFW